MKSEIKWDIVLAIIAFFFFALVFEMAAHADNTSDDTWNARMQSMAKSITCLAPFVASDEKFKDVKNRLQIRACVDELAVQTKSLREALTHRQDSKSSDALHQLDPLFPLMAISFADDIETARGLLDSQSEAYAQHLLRGSLSYCVSCHTRTKEHSTIKFPVFNAGGDDLKLSEQMKLYTATRNFDEALAAFDSAIKSPRAETMGSIELERSARLALAIDVRVENEAAKAIARVDQILKIKNLAPSFKTELINWKTGLSDMKSAPKNQEPAEKFKTAQELIKRAQSKAVSDQSRVPAIEYLRASSLIHQFLESRPSDQLTAEALFDLGTCYEHLEFLGFWSTNETYYEACIRKAPHSAIARRCLGPLKDSITVGYSGSAGVHIPANVRTRLRELESLANAKAK
jgi:tetratricopeptide (TPR) repeat protein